LREWIRYLFQQDLAAFTSAAHNVYPAENWRQQL